MKDDNLSNNKEIKKNDKDKFNKHDRKVNNSINILKLQGNIKRDTSYFLMNILVYICSPPL